MLTGCSHNNGGDTRFWGTWKLTSVTVNGTPDESYNGNYFWKFQADVICIMDIIDEMHQAAWYWGTWSISDNDKYLILNYTHSDDENPAGTGAYAPPSAIHITEGCTLLNILKIGGETMQLSHETSIGLVTYYFEKW